MIPLAALLLAVPISLPAADQEWKRVTTPRFTILSSGGDRTTRDMARDLETLAAALRQTQPGMKEPPPAKVIVFARRGEALPYLDFLLNRETSNATGVFVSQRGAATMLIDASRGRVADRTPYHELVHYLLSANDQRPPLWLEEGIAEYYSNAQVHGGAIRVGIPIREHFARLRRARVMPVRDLFAVTRGSAHATDLVFYAQSWAVVDWMLRANRKAFDALLRDVSTGMSSVDALRKHYARDPEFLDAIITSYTAPQYSMLLSASAPASVDVTPTPISRADVLYELARLLGSLDRGVADADRLFRAALDDNPRHALSLAGLGRLRSREMKDAEALALFERALESDPNDAIVNLMFAEALLRPEIGGLAETTQRTADDLPRFRRARELAEKALALHADETRALGAIGTSYIVEAGFTPGIAPLEKAHALFPNRSDFGLHLLALYVRNGDLSKAGALVEELKRVLPPPLQEVMTTILLRPDIDRVNKLVAGEKLDEAVAELRKLSASTTDANAKQQLDRQAAIIERDARRNREVNAFNDALKFSGDGNRDAAVKLLDQLLISASDATVLQSARQLRSALGARP